MAIKWKKFSYSHAVKSLAFLLTVIFIVFIIVSILSANIFWKSFDIKSLPPNKFNLEETQPFLNEIGVLADNAVDMLTKYISDEAVSSGEAFKLTEANIWAEYREEVSAEVEDRRNELEKYRQSAEEYGDYSQYLDMNYYTVAADGTLSVNVTNIEHVLKSVYNLKVQNEKNNFLSGYERVRQYFDKVINLRYAVVSKSEGTVVSNIQGADPEEDFDSVLKGSYPWYMSVTGASNVTVINKNNDDSVFSFYSGQDGVNRSETDLSEKLLKYHTEKDFDFYFAFNENADSDNCIFSGIMRSYDYARTGYTAVVWLLFSSLFIFILLIVYLVIVCGKDGRDSPVKLTRMDKLPVSLHLIISGLPVYLIIIWERKNLDRVANRLSELTRIKWDITALIVAAISGAIIACIVLEAVLSTVRHIKAKTVLSGSLTAKIIRLAGGRLDREKILDLKKSTLAAVLVYTAICTGLAIAAALSSSRWVTVAALLLILILNLSIYLIFLKTFTAFNEIRNLVYHIQRGEFDYKMDDSLMTATIKGFSDEVVGISNGIRIAVDRATRDEKTKTELITNVSHDLKTPLTSIVNYVELIKREESSMEDRQKYLSIIDEKAKQLKRLIDDLTEVSKLSGGNVEFHPVDIDLYEFALQVVGESSDELEKAKIDVRIKEPQCRPMVFADGQKTWRIMENLISNVVKYAMPETRTYVEVSADEKFGYVTIKNISAASLDLSGDELCARFTRGDPSRTSEGFGLGLSIAQSLCELQNGVFTISVDGDMFKATVALPLANKK
ncbi:MAG: HAMP domain-containing histidine kinase [Clostridiales bacterium]|nr:HAMP domain-containing histidine kinase [Clostridiales bacterium]